MSRRAMTRWPWLLLGAFVSTAPVAAGAGEAAPAGFVATASAQDARITYSVLGFAAVEDVVDGGGTVAQAQLDGGGNSRSFAALPYPGDLVVNGPGLFAFATGQQLPGGYPFFVAAETPVRPEAKLDGPGGHYALAAQAAPRRSSGQGRLIFGDGESGGRTQGEAITELTDDGTIRAVATSITEGFALAGGQFRIGAVRSSSTTTLAPGADRPVSTSGLAVEGMVVGGLPVTVGPDGLAVAGSALPGVGLAAVEEKLAEAGIEVQLVEAQARDGGERARSLEIRALATPPFPGFPPQQVVITLGGATTAIKVGRPLPGALSPLPPVVASEPAPPAPSEPGSEAPGAPPAPVAAAAPGRAPVRPGPPAVAGGPRGFVSLGPTPEAGDEVMAAPAVTSSPAAPAPAAPGSDSTRTLQRVTLARGLRHPITAFYLPLAVGVAVAFAGTFLWLMRGGTRA